MSDILNKVSQAAKDLAVKIQDAIAYDDDGSATLPETFTADNLTAATGDEAITMETVKAVQNGEATFATALALGLGNSAQVHMTTKPEVERVSTTLAYGNNNIRASVDRKVMVRAPGSSEEKPKFGNVSLKLDSGAAAKRGDLKRVVTHVNEAFTAAFNK